MIICYEGTPGSGKTYDSVNRIKDNLRLGRVIYTNIEGMADPSCKRALQDLTGLSDFDFAKNFNILTDDQVVEFWDHVQPGSMIVLDEIHKIFNSRDWQSEKNRRFADWASTHRHYGIDLYLITQRIEKIDSQVRTLVEWTYHYRKLNFMGSLFQSGYIRTTFFGEDKTDKHKTETLRYNPLVFKCYQSYVSRDLKEVGTEKMPNLFRHPIFYAIPIVLIFTIYMATRSSAIGGVFFGDKITDRLTASAQTLSQPLPPEPPLEHLMSHKLPPPGAGEVAVAPPAPGGDAFMTSSLPAPPSRRLVGVIDGKMIYKCGGRLCD